MVALTIAGTVAAFNYVDNQTNNALSSYAKHRFEAAADYVTNGAWKKLINKTNEKLKGKTIEQDPNLEFVDEILEKTKLQTDDNLLDLWASLLANAMQGKNFIRREYFDILSKLNPYDVVILNIAIERENEINSSKNNSIEKNVIENKKRVSFLKEKYNLDDDETEISRNLLVRLGLFSEGSLGYHFQLTSLGKGLKKALTVDPA